MIDIEVTPSAALVKWVGGGGGKPVTIRTRCWVQACQDYSARTMKNKFCNKQLRRELIRPSEVLIDSVCSGLRCDRCDGACAGVSVM